MRNDTKYYEGYKLGKHGEEYPENEKHKDFLFGYLDGLTANLNDIKSDYCRLEKELKEEIRELKSEARGIDRSDDEFYLYECKSCGNSVVSEDDVICPVCG